MGSAIVSLLVGTGTDVSSQFWAYLDPGSGSMLFQFLIAGVLSALFCARSTLLELRSTLFGNRPQE